MARSYNIQKPDFHNNNTATITWSGRYANSPRHYVIARLINGKWVRNTANKFIAKLANQLFDSPEYQPTRTRLGI